MVFYCIAWHARKGGTAKHGEADFVIVHPDLGLLVLDVKRGRIQYNGATWQCRAMLPSRCRVNCFRRWLGNDEA